MLLTTARLNGYRYAFDQNLQNQNQPLEDVLEIKCSVTMLKQLKRYLQEFILE